jgi:acrosin
VTGDGSTTLNVDDSGSTAANTGALSGSSLSGMGVAGINYSALATLNFWLGSGATNLTVQSTAAQTNTNINLQRAAGAVSINTLAGSYTINIGSLAPAVGGIVNNIQGAVNVTGDGNVTLNIDDTGSTAANTGTLTSSALTGLGMGAAGITYSQLAALNVSLGSGTNTFTVSSVAAGTITSVNVPNTQSSSKTTITTFQGTDIVNLGPTSNWQGPGPNGFQGPVKVVGDGSDTLNVYGVGNPVPAYNTLTSTTLSVGSSQTQQITYSGQAALNIWLSNQGGNLMTIVSTNPGTVTTITGGGQTNVINVESTASPTYINAQNSQAVINISSQTNDYGVLNNIQGSLIVIGGGNTTLVVSDIASTVAKTGMLTSGTLTGFGMGSSGIVYSGLGALNLYLGNGSNTLTIASTAASTTTTVLGNGGKNTINVQNTTGLVSFVAQGGAAVVNIGSLAPANGGIVNNIQGSVCVNGYGGANVTVNVDDTGSTATNVGTLTNNSLTGLGMVGGLTYQGVGALNITLGSGNNTFTIASTNSGTVTSLHGGSGVNSINVQNISSATTVTTQANASDVINVGLSSGWQGWGTNGLQGLLTIAGNGRDIMNVYEEGAPGPVFNTLTANTLNPGTGQQSQGITYTGVAGLNVFLAGSNANFTVVSTNASTVTTINVISGNQTINIQSTAAGSATYVNTPGGVNVINIGSKAPQTGGITNNIQGDLVVNGADNDTMNIDDTGSTAALTGTLTGTTISGLGMDAFGIVYNGLTALHISLGSGADTFTIASTSSGTSTTLNTGGGNDTVNILSTSFATTINTQSGADTINVGSLAPATNGILTGLQGGLTVTGDKSDTLNVDDGGGLASQTGTLTSSTLVGLGSGGITYSGLTKLNIYLSSPLALTVKSTNSSTVTTVNGTKV